MPTTAGSRRHFGTRLASPPLILSVIVLLAFALRAGAYLEAPRPINGAGLVAEQGELARNIVEHGKWFVANRAAVDAIGTQQSEEGQLIDPSDFDYSRFDKHPSYSPEIQQMPGIAVVLAGLWWLGGTNTYSSIQWLQILLDTSMVLLIYWIALKFGCGRGTAARLRRTEFLRCKSRRGLARAGAVPSYG